MKLARGIAPSPPEEYESRDHTGAGWQRQSLSPAPINGSEPGLLLAGRQNNPPVDEIAPAVAVPARH